MEKPRGWGGMSGRDDQSGRKGVARDWATCRCVVAAVKGETCLCGCLDCLLLEIFPPVGRSGRGDSKGGVAG